MKKYLYVLLGFIIVGLIIGKLTIWKSSGTTTDTLITVTRMDLAQEVLVTGRVKSSRDVNLAFTHTGKITSVNVQVGDAVAQGNALVRQDSTDLNAQLAAAEAGAAAEDAKLRDMQAGTRPEEITIQEAKVTNATAAIVDASQSLIDKIRDAVSKSDDAIHNRVDQMFSNPQSNNPQLAFVTDGQSSTDLTNGRVKIESLFIPWSTQMNAITTDSDLQTAANTSRTNLNTVSTYLDKLSLVVNQLSTSASINTTTLNGWRADLATARANMQTALSNISIAVQSVNTANATLQVEKSTLALDKAGSTVDQLTAEINLASEMHARVDQLTSQITDTVMRAPSDGVVSTVNAKVGQIATAGEPLVRVVSRSAYEIDANIPETDIGNVMMGNPVIITLDAFAGETFMGKVVLVDPAETVVDGVVNFKTTIRFDKVDPRVKSGMTANLRIQTIMKKQVLALPQYAIIENDKGKFVSMDMSSTTNRSNTTYSEFKIQTGIRNPEGFVEILSGVNEGDRVLNIGIKQK